MDWSERLRQISLKDITITVFTLLGITIFDFVSVARSDIEIPLLGKVLISVALIIVYGFYASSRGFKTQRSFPEASASEAKFFKNWYSRSGILHIFCNDLLWLDTDPYAGVIFALKAKAAAGELFLYLRKTDHALVQELTQRGAVLFKIRSEIITTHRFSIRVDD